MFAVYSLFFLLLLSMSHSAPLDCNDLLKPLDEINPSDFKGRWAMVADSMRTSQPTDGFPTISSIVLDIHNVSLTKGVLISSEFCNYDSFNVTLNGSNYELSGTGTGILSGRIYSTTCPDCVVLSFNVYTPYFKGQELCLFSRRRQLEPKELQEFVAQVKCLGMPEPVFMDPNEMLCPPYQES